MVQSDQSRVRFRGKTEENGAVDPVEEPSQRQHKGGLARAGQHI